MLSSIFKGNSMIFGATGLSMLLGGMAGGLMIYSYQNEATTIDYWNKLWSEYRSKYPSMVPPWQHSTNILTMNDNEYLKSFIAPKLPKLSSPSQIQSIRIFVPLCGANEDLNVINDFMMNRIKTETHSEGEAAQYVVKIIGIDASEDALQMFLDKVDMKEKEINPIDIDYNNEYNFKNNHYLYQIDDDIFSGIQIYKYKNYNLINCDIFNPSITRLVLRADAIYDNQALSIINPKRRKQYVYLMQNVLARKGKILLVTERYNVQDRDENQQNLAPYSVNNKNEIFNLYKKMVNMELKNIKLLNSIPWSDEKLKNYGFPENYNNAYSDIWLIESSQLS